MFYTIKKSPKAYLECLSQYANHYRSKHVMITAGMDFAYQFAHLHYEFFDNVTSFFGTVPGGKKFKFQFSTVDDYMRAAWGSPVPLDSSWPSYSGDFFPLNGYHKAHYWTGYYSSRPNFKKLIRDFTGIVEASDTIYGLELLRQMLVGGGVATPNYKVLTGQDIMYINNLVGTSIHHDTLTGTSPTYVIQNETNTLRDREISNARVLSLQIKDNVLNHKALTLNEPVDQCLQQIQDKFLCEKQTHLERNRDQVIVIHNPDVRPMTFVSKIF